MKNNFKRVLATAIAALFVSAVPAGETLPTRPATRHT